MQLIAKMTTLKELLEEHPEWADLPIAVYNPQGGYDYVGCSGDVYSDDDGESSILVFSHN